MMFLNAQKPGLIKDPYIYKPDSIMLDLEDAVAENQKDAARFSLYHALQTIDYRGCERVVRINGLDTPYWREDIRCAVAGGCDAIRIPKTESAQDVKVVEEEVEKAEAANADTIEEKAMAEGVEAAGEIEAVGDTGEAKAFEEKQKTAKTESAKDMPKDVKRSMYFMLASIFLWFTAYNAVTTAFSRYTKVVWKMEGGSFANCLMVATVAAILSYIPIGNISAKIGRKKTIMGGVLLMAACYGSAIFAREYHPVVNVAFALIGVAWAAINVNSYPMIVAMSSGSDVGKFTGTYYTFSMAAQILTPVLSGFLLENVSYNTLFPYALFFSLMAFLTMTQVRHGDVKPQKKESILENFDVDD